MKAADLDRCRDDPVFFCRAVLNVESVWAHQAEVLRSNARVKCLKKGRRSGGTTAIGYMALWTAFRKPGSQSLIVSAREDAAKRIIEECQVLADKSELLRDAVVTEFKTELRFVNGSRITAVAATDAAIRGFGLDYAALDEAFQLRDSIWRAVEPAIVDRPGSEIWIVSTPGNSPLHFFNRLWRRGMEDPSERVQSWHWTTSMSPRIDSLELSQLQAENDEWYFRREFLAEDSDDLEAVFPDSVLFGSIAHGAVPMGPEEARKYRTPVRSFYGSAVLPTRSVAIGVDPGGSRDPHAIAVIAPVEDHGHNGRDVYAVMHLETLPGRDIDALTARVLELGRVYDAQRVVPESSGLGFHWANGLVDKFNAAGITGFVIPLGWTNESKTRVMGQFSGMLQEGTLIVPEGVPLYAELLAQLRSMGRENLPAGGIRLAARQGHDDLVLACALALSSIEPRFLGHDGGSFFGPDFPHVVTGSGTICPLDCQPVPDHHRGWRDPRRI